MAQDYSSALGSYVATPIKLFIADPALLKQVAKALNDLGFNMVIVCKVPPNYFQAMKQLFAELLRTDEGLVLVNHPPKQMKDNTGMGYTDYAFADFYGGVASLIKSAGRRAETDMLGMCVPVFTSAQDHDIRLRTIEDLFPYGIVGAFMLRVQELYGNKAQMQQERTDEMRDYLAEYFQNAKGKRAELREYKSAEELKKRRAECERLMAEVEEHKKAGDFDKAIALCRRAMDVLPTDPEAYLEGGRLLVKKKKYPPAMEMFRDAERVAENLPVPNQEIANLRVSQAKDYIEKKRQLGQEPDMEVVEGFLKEAEDNFKTALNKADQLVTARSDQAGEKRKDTAIEIAESILGLELEDLLGESHPMVRSLGGLAQQTLTKKVGSAGQVQTKYLVHIGLGAFLEGDLQAALTYLTKAAELPELFQDACTKLNYIGTQLRQRGDVDLSIKVYKLLMELKPPFAGVVLFNMAVALQSKANNLAMVSKQYGLDTETEAVGRAVEAIYVDPTLPKGDNFYHNTIIAPQLRRITQIITDGARAAAQRKAQGDPADAACAQAVQKLEALLAQGKDREALHLMFDLAQKLRPFFVDFHKHASQPVAAFAKRLHPVLLKHATPKMQLFGKILGVLVAQYERASQIIDLPQPLHAAMAHLNKSRRADAARELAKALYQSPALALEEQFLASRPISDLCVEAARKLAAIGFERFDPTGRQAA